MNHYILRYSCAGSRGLNSRLNKLPLFWQLRHLEIRKCRLSRGEAVMVLKSTDTGGDKKTFLQKPMSESREAESL